MRPIHLDPAACGECRPGQVRQARTGFAGDGQPRRKGRELTRRHTMSYRNDLDVKLRERWGLSDEAVAFVLEEVTRSFRNGITWGLEVAREEVERAAREESADEEEA